MIKGFIFDLDGVIVDTAIHHFQAWKALARRRGYLLGEDVCDRVRGVSRARSLEIVLESAGWEVPREERGKLAEEKNADYLSRIQTLTTADILPGAGDFLEHAKSLGYKIALGSASKNAPLILRQLGLTHYFDDIVDGTLVTRAKPDPEVFVTAAGLLGLPCGRCLVFEDAAAGIEAAHNAGMPAVGIGDPVLLCQAELVLPGFSGVSVDDVIDKLMRRIGQTHVVT